MLSFDKEHVFAEYEKHIGERYVIYRVYDEVRELYGIHCVCVCADLISMNNALGGFL